MLSSKKGISAPGADLRIDAVTKKDFEDVRFAVGQKLDYLAFSFVRTGQDVGVLTEFLSSLGVSIPIEVKIEKPEALMHFEEILAASDAVMIVRGDLGVETPPEQGPFTQKRSISECRRAAKAVITATQLLDSMMEHPRPTRAEASDVANAILDGTGAVMLSGETAAGKYPVQSVAMMARIAEFSESNIPHAERIYAGRQVRAANAAEASDIANAILDGTSAVMLSGETAAGKYPVQSVAMMTRIAEFSESNIPHDEWIDENHHVRAANAAEAISQATVEIAHELGAKAIVTSTYSGLSARLVARHRPRTPIVAITPKAEVNRQMGLLWGVVPKLVPMCETTDKMIDASAKAVLETGLARVGDTIVITAGAPPGAGQTTNIVQVHVIQE